MKNDSSTFDLVKRATAAIAAFAACIALTAGGTLAYFSVEKTAHNVITTGFVDITLHEWADEGRNVEWDPNVSVPVMPGAEKVKIVEVAAVDGSADVWVRAKVDTKMTLSDGTELTNDQLTGVISLDFNAADWTLKDGYWYYDGVLGPNGVSVTEPLFEKVSFSGSGMGNAYQDAEIVIDVKVHATQMAYNGSSATDPAVSWSA